MVTMATTPYREDYLLGTGGMAEVWHAVGPSGAVAVKRLLPHAARNPSVAAAFEREGRLLQRIQHANVIAIHQVLRDERGTSLVLEYVNGTDLRALDGRGAPERVALRIIRDLLGALEAVHTLCDDSGHPLGLIHRDLSPSNVLVSVDGRVKLADFGIARAASGTHATTGVNMKGTVAYLSPEQAIGAAVDARADLFAVGALLYELLSGAPIYDEDDPRLVLARARAGDVQSLGAVKEGAPFALVELVDRALSATPADRFPSSAVMRAEVERVADQTFGLASDEELADWARELVARTRGPEPVPSPLPETPSRRRRTAVLALATCGVLGVGYWLTRPSLRPDASPAPAPAAIQVASAAPAMVAQAIPPTSPDEARPMPSSEASRQERRPAGRVGVVASRSAPAPSRSSGNDESRPLPKASANSTPGEKCFVDIGSEPAFAYVTIDGVKVGATPLFGREVAPGVHQVRVAREGLGEKSFTIEVHPGDRIQRVVKLP